MADQEAKLLGGMSQEERQLIESKVTAARTLMEVATLHMLRYRPFYGAMISSMPVVEATTWLTAMATNGRDLFFNPEFISGMSPERRAAVFARIDSNPDLTPDMKVNIKHYIEFFYQEKTPREVSFCIEHEIRHVVSEHCHRSKGYDPKLFNQAADYHNNISIIAEHAKDQEGMKAWFPKGIDTDFNILNPGEEFYFMRWLYIDKKYDRWVTELIYEDILKTPPPSQNGGGGQDGSGGQGPKGGDTHPDQNGNMQPDDEDRGDEEGGFSQQDVADALGLDKGDTPRLSREQKAANDSIMRRAIEAGVKAAGKGSPEEARKFVDEMGSPKINYLRYLRKTLVALVKENVSYASLSRRTHSLTFALRKRGIIDRKKTVALPARQRGNTIDVHVFFDVSGSFTNDLLAPVRRELRGICGMYEEFKITLAAWSTKVGNVCTYTKANCREMENYKISTTYGTAPMCIFNYLKDEEIRTDQLIIFTDGVFEDLSGNSELVSKYGDKTLWVILGRHHDWKPPFGKCIIFDKYQR